MLVFVCMSACKCVCAYVYAWLCLLAFIFYKMVGIQISTSSHPILELSGSR